MAEVYFLRSVIENDLRHIGRQDVPLVLKELMLLETDALAGTPLGGDLTGFRKLNVGRNTYRIVYRVRDGGATLEICEVWVVGHRRNDEVYAEATRRVREAAATRPELANLAELMARLGRSAPRADRTPPPDPVPEWLYKPLVHTAGLPPQQVTAMTGEEAFNAWNSWISRQR